MWSVPRIDSVRFEDDHRMCENENVDMSSVEKVLPDPEVEHRGWSRTKSTIVAGEQIMCSTHRHEASFESGITKGEVLG